MLAIGVVVSEASVALGFQHDGGSHVRSGGAWQASDGAQTRGYAGCGSPCVLFDSRGSLPLLGRHECLRHISGPEQPLSRSTRALTVRRRRRVGKDGSGCDNSPSLCSAACQHTHSGAVLLGADTRARCTDSALSTAPWPWPGPDGTAAGGLVDEQQTRQTGDHGAQPGLAECMRCPSGVWRAVLRCREYGTTLGPGCLMRLMWCTGV